MGLELRTQLGKTLEKRDLKRLWDYLHCWLIQRFYVSLSECFQLLILGNYLMSSKEHLQLFLLAKTVLKFSQARAVSGFEQWCLWEPCPSEKHSRDTLCCRHTCRIVKTNISEWEITQGRWPSPFKALTRQIFLLSLSAFSWPKSSLKGLF